MNPYHIAQIGIRLVAIYLIAQGISAIYSAYMVFSSFNPLSEEPTYMLSALLLAVISPGAIGIVLWYLAPRLSKYFISGSPTDSKSDIQFDFGQLQSIVIVLMGVYILANNIPNAISVTYYLFTNKIEVNGVETFDTKTLISVFTVNLKLFLGIALIIGSNAITRFTTKLRTIGT